MTPSRLGIKRDAPDPYGAPMTPEQRRLARLVFAGFLALFTVIGVRLHFVHLMPNESLNVEEAKHIGEMTLQEPRGEIYDRNAIRLATNKEVASLWVDPSLLPDLEAFAAQVAPMFHLDYETLLSRLRETTPDGNLYKFKWIKRWITEQDELLAVSDLMVEYQSIAHIEYESVRHYPQRMAAAQLLGFVNRNNEASEGVELVFDKHLRSEPGIYRARTDTRRRLLESRVLEYVPPKAGESLQLTLDINIQHNLERVLDQRMIETKASQGMGMLMDPFTGEILALATRPSFDPNYYESYTNDQRRNKAITDPFEPGSAFKIVTAAAAIEEGLITPATMIDCENGGFNPYGHYIRDFYRLGVEPFSKAFEDSSNVAIIKVAKMLGPERLEQWIRAFGFGQRTSRDFPPGAETAGQFRERKDWNRLSMGSLPMGQEISVTIPQLARAFAVIANGGYLVEPHFVKRAIAADGTITFEHEPGEHTRIISEQTAATMRELLHLVVLNGTGSRAAMPEYTAGGKTGTAQMASLTGRGYSKDRYTTVFAGIAPIKNPRLVGVIVVKEPMIRERWGGFVCGPVFKEVVRDALVRLNVPADIEPEEGEERVIVAKATRPAKPAAEAAEEVAADSDTLIDRLSEEEIQALLAQMENDFESLDTLELMETTRDPVEGEPVLPDLTGLTKRQAYAELGRLNIQWDPHGAGRVVSQIPPPGTPISQVQLCALEFAHAPQDDPAAEEVEEAENETS